MFDQSKFYIRFNKGSGKKGEFSISSDQKSLADPVDVQESETSTKKRQKPPKQSTSEFYQLNIAAFDTFLAIYDSIPLIVGLPRVLPEIYIDREIVRTCEKIGKICQETDEFKIIELQNHDFPELNQKLDKLNSLTLVNRHVADYLLLGLVAAYDQFISNLAKLVIEKKPDILDSSEKRLTLSELTECDSIADARDIVLEAEIEGLLRKSHEEQFKWFGERLKMKIEPAEPLMAKFLELCERRNLVAHAGGRTSSRYIKLCSKRKLDSKDLTIGKRLRSTNAYLGEAAETIIEIAVQLVHVVWQRLEGNQSSEAAKALVHITYNLIRDKKYRLAIQIIEFLLNNNSTQMDGETRRTHVINLTNAMKLSGRDGYLETLKSEDWSVKSLTMAACLAAIRDDDDDFLESFGRSAKAEELTLSEFKAWPVFESMRLKPNICAEIYKLFQHTPSENKERKSSGGIFEKIWTNIRG